MDKLVTTWVSPSYLLTTTPGYVCLSPLCTQSEYSHVTQQCYCEVLDVDCSFCGNIVQQLIRLLRSIFLSVQRFSLLAVRCGLWSLCARRFSNHDLPLRSLHSLGLFGESNKYIVHACSSVLHYTSLLPTRQYNGLFTLSLWKSCFTFRAVMSFFLNTYQCFRRQLPFYC